MLSIRNISKIFRNSLRDKPFMAIEFLTFDVQEGEFVSIIGPSGCGKSTFLRMVGAMETPTSGEITFRGERVRLGDTRIIMVWQDFALFDWRTVQGNIEFGLEMKGIPKEDRRRRVRYWMEIVGLQDFAQHFPAALSGGMKQRVGLARALVMEPEILLMDEPFGSLDAQTRLIMQEELLRIWEQSRKTILFVTHSIEEAILLSDRILVFTASPARLKEDFRVDLPRPRSLLAIKNLQIYNEIYDHLYHSVREEVLKSLRDTKTA